MPSSAYTPLERERALALLRGFAVKDRAIDLERYDAWPDFMGGHEGALDHIPEGSDHEGQVDDAYDTWFLFDRRLDESGRRVVEHFLEAREELDRGGRAYLESMGRTTLRLYEVTEVVFGESITLRDLLEAGPAVRVSEGTLSRHIERFEVLLARVVERGVSGGPEIEGDPLALPPGYRGSAMGQLERLQREIRAEEPELSPLEMARQMAPLLFQSWLAVFEAPMPKLMTTDGEEVAPARVVFRVLDRERLIAVLDDAFGLEAERSRAAPGARRTWSWSGPNARGDRVVLGSVELGPDRLFVQVHSRERAASAQRMIEALAGAAVQHRMTIHESLEDLLGEAEAEDEAETEAGGSSAPSPKLPEIEALTLDYLARHYHAWVDEPVPALDGKTPREAAAAPAMVSRVVALLKELEVDYYRRLAAGEPAHDPSWMWADLGLEGHPDAPRSSPHVPPLAHESMARLVPGFSSFVKELAKRLRKRPDFDLQRVFSGRELGDSLEFQRYLRRYALAVREEVGLDADEAIEDANILGFHAAHALNHEVHLRKTFWIDERLATMLDETDADVPGELVKLPFAAFALVFTDRHVLGLAEHLLALETESPLAGHRLRVVTVYVHEEPGEAVRSLRVTFAFDVVGAEWPWILSRVLPIGDATSLKDVIRAHSAEEASTDPVFASPRVARLVNLVMNAVLYATSSGVTHVVGHRPAPKTSKGKSAGRKVPIVSSDEIYHFPGHIDLSLVRKVHAVERAPTGRQLLHRFMVRGHWRKPNPSWSDQSMRWIEPYWKGPEMAAIIERAYRLKAGEELPEDGA